MTANADRWEASRERIHAARQANQDRAAERQWQRYDEDQAQRDEAAALIGQLCRDGKPVFYVNLRKGGTKEGDRETLIAFLIRNKYV